MYLDLEVQADRYETEQALLQEIAEEQFILKINKKKLA